ncbi:N-acetylglucosamine-6-phosphate deacetylase [Gracilibacillus caseinilyticus]|uniref:N-acetylglucosamine-6-phosphate deacetylase n=1 Tax=Gracilibacillus caseinilyticus TaxID=2932256 RepID=A0ABY4ES53_9BACI|nr:N-acetylglucosamine-6-phosphate deacetylase [Gracilibacillus caseinilyticus]UOQ46713.1 N-acetylglucosamine-6-phosphate deacetylase [Gracilibacillus caseinilyticus]
MSGQKLLLKNLTIYTENQSIDNGYIKINDQKIEEINELDMLKDDERYRTLDFSNTKGCAIPGLIDVHIHGANGADVMDATPEALETMAQALPMEGTTSFLATTMTQSEENIEKALENTAAYIKRQPNQHAEVIGIHLEGPFINKVRKGAQPEEHILKPDVALFKKWNELAADNIKLVTLAPEVDGAELLIRYLTEQGIVASAGHTDATAAEIELAMDQGLSHITHLYNQMRGFHHREPGVVGAAWQHKQLMVEMIADGVHSTPYAVKTAYDLIGKDNLLLITDAIRAKCLQGGEYELGGQKVFVEDNKATLEDGTLAGSTLKLNDAVKNIMQFSGCSLPEAVSMSSTNAAKELGMTDRKGSLATGKDADIVLLDDNHDILLTLCRGEIAYERK